MALPAGSRTTTDAVTEAAGEVCGVAIDCRGAARSSADTSRANGRTSSRRAIEVPFEPRTLDSASAVSVRRRIVGSFPDAPSALFDDRTGPIHDQCTVTFAERLRAATELLEQVAADRRLLADLSEEEQRRLIRAAGVVFNPDVAARRKAVKALERRRKAERTGRDEGALQETGIRLLRRKRVFTAPNILPPPALERPGGADVGETGTHTELERRCYICKQAYTAIHHFYDQLCPPCADSELRQTHRVGRPRRSRRAADRRPRQDWLPSRAQAASGRSVAHRHDTLPARLGKPLFAGARLCGVARPPRDFWTGLAAYPQRRGVLP